MSSKNNVNPDHYKVRGSLRQGEDLIPELEKQKAAKLAKSAPAGPKESRPIARKRKPAAGEAREAEGAPERAEFEGEREQADGSDVGFGPDERRRSRAELRQSEEAEVAAYEEPVSAGPDRA